MYSRDDPFSLSSSLSSSVVKYCPLSTVFAIPSIGAQFFFLKVFWKICESSARFHATGLPVLLHRSEKFDLLSTLLVAFPWFPGYFTQRVSLYSSELWDISAG